MVVDKPINTHRVAADQGPPSYRFIEMEAGNTELALELALYCLQHPSTGPELTGRAVSLRTELAAQLTPQQIEAARERSQQVSSLDGLSLAALALH